MRLRLFSLMLILFFAPLAHAGLWGEFGGYIGNDGLETATSTTAARSYYHFDFYGNLDNNHRYFLGFHVHQMAWTGSQAGGTEEQFSTMDMGPAFMWAIDEKGRFDLFFAYNVTAKATFNDGTNEAELKGTSYVVSFGFQPEFKEPWRIGFRLNYYAGSYNEQTISGTTTDVSYTRSWIYPSIVFSYRK